MGGCRLPLILEKPAFAPGFFCVAVLIYGLL
jgi:hypothetical protein